MAKSVDCGLKMSFVPRSTAVAVSGWSPLAGVAMLRVGRAEMVFVVIARAARGAADCARARGARARKKAARCMIGGRGSGLGKARE